MQQLSVKQTTVGEVIKSTLSTRGPFGFYKGLDSMVYFVTPKAAIRFSAFEASSNALRGADGAPMFGKLTSFIAGLCAGAMEAVAVTTPQVRMHGLRRHWPCSTLTHGAAAALRRRSRLS